MPTPVTKDIFLSNKTVKIACSEEDALAILVPYAKVTALQLLLNKRTTAPGMSALGLEDPPKEKMCSLLSIKLETPITPDTISIVCIELTPRGGQFLCKLRHTIPIGNGYEGNYVQFLNVTFY